MAATIIATEYSGFQNCVVGLIYLIGGILAIFTNGRTIQNLLSRPLLPTPSKILHVHSAIANIGVIAGFPFAVSSCFGGGWLFGNVGCKIYAFEGFFFGIAAFYMILLIAFERYLATCCANWHKCLNSCWVNLAAVGVWTTALVWSILPLLGFGRYDLEPHGTSCTIDWMATDDIYYTYMTSLLIFGFSAPLGLASLFHLFAWIAQDVNINSDQKNILEDHSSAEKTLVKEAEINMIGRLLLLVSIAAWCPYALVTTWSLFSSPRHVPLLVSYLPPMTAKLGTALLPLVYSAASKAYRSPHLFMSKTGVDSCRKND